MGGRKAAARWGASFCLHFSCAATDREYRRKLDSQLILTEICRQVWSKGGVVTWVHNIPYFEHWVALRFKNQAEIMERVPYTSLNLSLGGRKVFHSLEHLKYISYMVIHK